MSVFDDFMARGARLRGVTVRRSSDERDVERAIELLRLAIRANTIRG
ncbi:MAG: hypothetical protein WEE03_08805 [Chloroflexota bacterium]